MIGTCPSCGNRTGGILRQCKACKAENTMLGNLDSKTPHRPLGGDSEDEQ